MQELQWRPQSLGASSKTESAKDVVFSFYEGKLYRIVVDYDRYGTEGLTAADFVDAISAIYGPPAKPADPVNVASGSYGDRETTLAQWQDSQNRFDLIRSSYGPTFKLVGVVKTLEVSAQAANLEARRLDDQEAPQRDAARLASDEAAAKAKLEAARLVTSRISGRETESRRAPGGRKRYSNMTSKIVGPTFREGDEVVLAQGSHQGTLGVFLRLREDVNWADITERNGDVRSHPVIWLAHCESATPVAASNLL
jgi:hypothetical protein